MRKPTVSHRLMARVAMVASACVLATALGCAPSGSDRPSERKSPRADSAPVRVSAASGSRISDDTFELVAQANFRLGVQRPGMPCSAGHELQSTRLIMSSESTYVMWMVRRVACMEKRWPLSDTLYESRGMVERTGDTLVFWRDLGGEGQEQWWSARLTGDSLLPLYEDTSFARYAVRRPRQGPRPR